MPIKTTAEEKITVETAAEQKASVFEGDEVAEAENRTRYAVWIEAKRIGDKASLGVFYSCR